MGQNPATGTAIRMSGLLKSYYNLGPTGCAIGGSFNPLIGRSSTVLTSLSNTFGGQFTPYPYV